MYKVVITVEYWGLEKEECKASGVFAACKTIYKAEMYDYKSVQQYIAYMLSKNSEALSFSASVKPMPTKGGEYRV